MSGRRCLASTRFRKGLHGECGAMAPQQKTAMTCAREWDSSTCSRQASALSRPAERRSFLRRKETHMSTITTTSPETSSPLTRLITRHPLIAFFVLAFAGTWIAFLPLVLAQNGMGLLPYTIPEIGPYPPSYIFAALGALLGPTLASFTVTAITTGKAGVRQLLRRYVIWRVGLRWYLLVLVGVPLFQLVCSSVFLGIAPLTALIQQWPLYFTTFLPNVLIIAVAVQIWEEGGWSGYAVPNLQKRFGAL